MYVVPVACGNDKDSADKGMHGGYDEDEATGYQQRVEVWRLDRHLSASKLLLVGRSP